MFLGLAASALLAPSAGAQTCGTGCLDFTVVSHEENRGYIEFQVLYTGTGTNATITGVQAVYMNTSITGVPLPPQPGGAGAEPVTNITYNSGTVGNRGTLNTTNNRISGLDFSFTAADGSVYRMNGWTTLNASGIVIVTNTTTSTNFNCQGNAPGPPFDHCHYVLTSSVGGSIAIPEIDGHKAPQVLLFLSGLYLLVRRRARERRVLKPALA